MAQPQRENGHTGIANEIMDALGRTPLGNANAQILWVILRKTYGWNKKADSISITQFMNITGLSRRTVVYALQNLEAKNMITVQRNKTEQSYNDVNLIGFQKDYDKWVVQGIAQNYKKTLQKQRDNYKGGVVQGKEGSARIGKKVVQGLVNDEPFLAPTIDTITKESITKERILVHFQEFYTPYPRKEAKQEALKAWNTLAPDEALLSIILEALKKHKEVWTTEGRATKHIPLPASWIRGRRWEDEISHSNDWRNNPKGIPIPERTRHNLAVIDALAREREEKATEQKKLQEGERENERLREG